MLKIRHRMKPSRLATTLVLGGLLTSSTQCLAQGRNADAPQLDGFKPPASGHTSQRGYWNTPEGQQAAAEIRYQQAQQAFDRTYPHGAIPRSDAALDRYQELMVLFTAAMSHFAFNMGNHNPPLPILVKRSAPITDDQLIQDYATVMRVYFAGIRMLGLGTAWSQPPPPPPLPPIQNRNDPQYLAYAEALRIDETLVEKFSDRIYAEALRSRQTPPPFPLYDSRPVDVQEQRWCVIDLGSSTGRVPC